MPGRTESSFSMQFLGCLEELLRLVYLILRVNVVILFGYWVYEHLEQGSNFGLLNAVTEEESKEDDHDHSGIVMI
ncbi:hypothetical protein ACLB2K_051924 [Fragaria x ananassa]